MATPPILGPDTPPMVGQFDNASAVLSPLWQGIYEGMTQALHEAVAASGDLTLEWEDMSRAQREVLDHAKESMEEIATLRRGPEERAMDQAVLRSANLPGVARDRIMLLLDSLGVYGEEFQDAAQSQGRTQDEAREVMRERSEGRVDQAYELLNESDPEFREAIMTMAANAQAEMEEREGREADTRKARPAKRHESAVSQIDPPRPGDVTQTGAVRPEDALGRLDREGFSEGRVPGAGGQDPRSAQPAPTPPMTWDQAVRRGGDISTYRDMLVSRTRNRIDRWASEAGALPGGMRPDGVADFSGNWGWANPEEGAAYESAMGRFGPGQMSREGIWQWESPDDAQRYMARSNRVGRITGAMDAYSSGGGVSGAIGALAPGAARTLGGVGMAVGAANMIGGALESQRAANVPYTSTYGEGEMDAYRQRADEWMFSRLGTFGVMNSNEASRLYQGVAQTGWQGQDRRRALDFATSNYTDFGMDISTSMRLIQMAQEDGSDALDDYRQGLIAVGESAKDAGESVKEAQEDFINAMQEVRQYSSGEDAAEVASTFVSMEQALDSTGLAGFSLSGIATNESVQRQYALHTGQAYRDVEFAVSQGEQIGEILDFAMERFVDRSTFTENISEDTQGEISRIMDASGGTPSNQQVREIARMLTEDRAILDPTRAAMVAQTYLGRQVSPEEARQLIVRRLIEDNRLNFTAAATAAEQQWEEAGVAQAGLQPGFFDLTPSWQARMDLKEELGLASESGDSFWSANFRFGRNTVKGAPEVYDAVDEYLDQMRRGERSTRSSNLESLLAHIGGLSDQDPDAARAWNDQRFIALRDGEEVEFGMGDLPNYIREMEAGQVYTVDEKGRRNALHDVVGYVPRSSDPEAQASEQRVLVEVEAKGDLADVLSIRQAGGYEVESARATGTAMAPFGIPGLNYLFGGSRS